MFETISGFSDILEAIWGVLISIEVNDIIDIAVLSFLIYHLIHNKYTTNLSEVQVY